MSLHIFELPKPIKLKAYDKTYIFKYLTLQEYQAGGTHIALTEDLDSHKMGEDWSLSVWLEYLLPYVEGINDKVMFFVDHNLRHFPELLKTLEKQFYFKKLSITQQSGFVLFDSMVLDTTKLKKLRVTS